MVVPCQLDETVIGAAESNVRQDCNQDKDAAIKYLKSANIVVYHNDEVF